MNPEALLQASNDNHRVVFPFNPKTKKYQCDSYLQDFTSGRATRDEVDRVLQEIEEARKPFDPRIFKWQIVPAVLLIAFSATYSIWADQKMKKLKQDPNEIYEFYFQYFLLICAVLIVPLVTIVPKLKGERLFKLQGIISRHNQEFSRQGLRWYISSEELYTIQLYKEYLIQAGDNNGPEGAIALFYINPSSDKFTSDFYSSELTEGRISGDEMNQILTEFASFRKVHERRTIVRNSIFPVLWLIMVIVIYMVYASEFEAKRKIGEIYTPSRLFICVFVLNNIFSLVVGGFASIKLRNSQRSKCQAEIDGQNQKISSRGLKWQVPFFSMDGAINWVELVKNREDLESGNLPRREIEM